MLQQSEIGHLLQHKLMITKVSYSWRPELQIVSNSLFVCSRVQNEIVYHSLDIIFVGLSCQ